VPVPARPGRSGAASTLASVVLAVADWIIAAGAIGSAIGGLGAFGSAYYSYRSSTKSADAAREANEAMALTIKPTLKITVGQWGLDPQQPNPVGARVVVIGPGPWGNGSSWPATNVQIQFTLASGRQGSRSIDVLEPNPTPPRWGAREPPYLHVPIGEISGDWPPPDGDRIDVVVLFDDARQARTYRQTMAAVLRGVGDPRGLSVEILEEPRAESIADQVHAQEARARIVPPAS
jgi:hypothetical protein